MTPLYSDKVGDALKLAADAFKGLARKGTAGTGKAPIIYLSHLLQVAAWVAEHRGDEDQIIAAILHDYLEDIEGATEADLQRRFGDRVASMVTALSDSTTHPKPPWKERKTAYLARLRTERADVKLISACDKLHNAKCTLRDHAKVGDQVWARFTASKEETAWYYREVLAALGNGWSHAALEELRAAVTALLRAAGAE